jgi:hypothetical protein
MSSYYIGGRHLIVSTIYTLERGDGRYLILENKKLSTDVGTIMVERSLKMLTRFANQGTLLG